MIGWMIFVLVGASDLAVEKWRVTGSAPMILPVLHPISIFPCPLIARFRAKRFLKFLQRAIKPAGLYSPSRTIAGFLPMSTPTAKIMKFTSGGDRSPINR
jgi:hypothetical protein